MNQDILIERLYEALITGDRSAARRVVESATRQAEEVEPERVVTDLFWPVYELVERLHRQDQIERLNYQMATRMLRVLVDQQAARFERDGRLRKTVFACCGPSDGDELGAQMAVDLLESAGYTVRFAGGGIAADEIVSRVQSDQPTSLVMFASAPSDLPGIRQIIDSLREIGACEGTQIVVGGGVFNRADGLAEEIGADLWASNPLELVDLMTAKPAQRHARNTRSRGKRLAA